MKPLKNRRMNAPSELTWLDDLETIWHFSGRACCLQRSLAEMLLVMTSLRVTSHVTTHQSHPCEYSTTHITGVSTIQILRLTY